MMIWRVFHIVWDYIHPIPRQREIKKLIRLYVEENIY